MESHLWRGAYAESARAGEKALDLLPRGSAAWLLCAGQVAISCATLGELDRLDRVATRLADAATEGAPVGPLLFACARVAASLLLVRRYEAGDQWLARIDAAGSAVEADPAVSGRVRQTRAFRSVISGDRGAGLAGFELAAKDFERAGDLRAVCSQRTNVGYASLVLGQYERAAQTLREVLDQAKRLGLFVLVKTAKHNLGLALGRLGAYAEARALESEAVAEAHAQGDPRLESAGRIYLSIICALAGDEAGAEREARGAIESARENPSFRAYAVAVLARALLAQGRTAEALDRAREANALLVEQTALEEGEEIVRLALAEALAATPGADPLEVQQAVRAVHERIRVDAERIADPELRKSFLERAGENARIVALAKEWEKPRVRN
jgi:tetratricopeptide (TPR) repeat protein